MNANSKLAMRHGFFNTGFVWEQFQTLIDAMPDAVVAVDTNGAIVALNNQAQHSLGYGLNDLLGRSVDVLLPEAMQHQHHEFREQYVAHPHVRPMGKGRDLAARCADGKELPVDISLNPLLVANNKLVLATLRDATERRATEARIRRLNEDLEERVRQRTAELEAANCQLETYSYSVSHELRSPLRILRGFAELLTQELGAAGTEQARDHVAHIVDAALRMNQIIEGLLALARLDHHQLKCDTVDMTALAQTVVAELRAERGAQTIDFSIGSLPAAKGDAVLLHQVFANLLSNAVKYSGKREATVIAVRGHSEVGRSIYQVEDNGPGFEAKLADSVFDPFQRLSGADEFEGLGIGLTLARRIVERHAGRIWAEGTNGGGATFSFWLPV